MIKNRKNGKVEFIISKPKIPINGRNNHENLSKEKTEINTMYQT